MAVIGRNLCLLAQIMAFVLSLVSLAGMAQNPQAIPLGQNHESSLDEAEQLTLSTYESGDYSFKIGYPQRWQAKKSDPNNLGIVFGMIPPEEDPNNPSCYVVVQVEPLTADATLDQYTGGLLQTLRQTNAYLQILSLGPATLGGKPAEELIISTQEDLQSLMVLKIYAISDGIAYIITYYALAESYDYYLEIVRQVISSFEFIEAEKPIPEQVMGPQYPEGSKEISETIEINETKGTREINQTETKGPGVISVGPSGYDFPSIQEAIDAAKSGDTIEVHGGIYRENVNISKPLSLVGQDHPVVDGGEILLQAEGSLIQGFNVTNSRKGIVIISNSSAAKDNIVRGGDLGIALALSQNCTIDGNIVYNCSDSGIFVYGSSYNAIFGNVVRDSWDGLKIDSSNSNEIGNNTAINNSHFGVCLNESGGNMLTDNLAGMNQGAGIFIYRSPNNTITGNVARDNEYGIFLFESKDNEIYGNVLADNAEFNAADTLTNQWDDGSAGNYYGDFECLDSVNGICGTPYEIAGGSSVDRYPRAFEPSSSGQPPFKIIEARSEAEVEEGQNTTEEAESEPQIALKKPSKTEELITALKDEDPSVRARAAETLGGMNDTSAIEPLIRALGDNDSNVRFEAGYSLGKMGGPAVEPLIDAFDDPDSNVSLGSALALGYIGAPAVDPLIQCLSNQREKPRSMAAAALGEIKDLRAVDPLIQALVDEKWTVREYAAAALGEIGDQRAVEPLIQSLNDDEWLVRRKVADALGKTRDSRAVEPLVRTLADKEWMVREDAAEALGMLKDPRAVEPLIRALGDEEWLVRKNAAEALGAIGDPMAIAALEGAAKDDEPPVQDAVKEALARLGAATGVN
jgi:parallel beta-helix repeat protein